MKTFGLLVLMGLFCLCQAAPPSANKPNLKVFISKPGIDFVIDQIRTTYAPYFRGDLALPPFTFNSGVIAGIFQNIKIANFKFPNVTYTGKQNEFTLTLSGDALSFSGEWTYSIFGYQISGPLSGSTSDSDFSLTVSISPNYPDKLTVQASGCSVSFKKTTFKFGGWSAFDNVFQSSAKDYLSTTFCTLSTNLINQYFQYYLNSLPLSYQSSKYVIYQYFLVSDPQFSPKGAIFELLGLTQGTSIPTNPAVISNHKPNSFLEVCKTEEGFQSILTSYYNSGYLQFQIALYNEDVQPLFGSSTGANAFKANYVQIIGTKPPTIKFKIGFSEVEYSVTAEFFSGGTSTVKAEILYYLKGNLDFVDQTTQLTLSSFTSTKKILINNSGLSDSGVLTLLDKADTEILDYIKPLFSFTLPTLGSFQFKNPRLNYYNGYFCFSSDLQTATFDYFG